jgi:hypothetical protein
MKKLIAILLAMMLVFSMAACGASEETPEITSADPAATEPQDNRDEEAPTEPEEPEIELPEFSTDATIEETVLYDENDVRITATELTYNGYAAELGVVIENNSDKDLSFISNSIGYSCNSVNGYMIPDGYLSCDVAAGKKASDNITLSLDQLMLYGIYEIADLEVGFDISDEDYDHIYTGPCKILTSAADGYDYGVDHYSRNIASEVFQQAYEYAVPYFSTDVAYESKGLCVASQCLMVNQDDENILLLEVVNDSGKMVGVTTTDIAINGLTVCSSTWSHDTVNPGKTCIVEVNLSSVLEPEYCEVYGISQISTAALKLAFKDSDGKEVADAAQLSVAVPDVTVTLSKDGAEVYNEDGVRIVAKGVYEDPSEYSDDLHILLLAENTSGKVVKLSEVYNSLSVNDFMTSFSMSQREVVNGSCAMIDIILWGYGLDDINITSIDDISTVDFSISIKNEKYKELDTAEIHMDVA